MRTDIKLTKPSPIDQALSLLDSVLSDDTITDRNTNFEGGFGNRFLFYMEHYTEQYEEGQCFLNYPVTVQNPNNRLVQKDKIQKSLSLNIGDVQLSITIPKVELGLNMIDFKQFGIPFKLSPPNIYEIVSLIFYCIQCPENCHFDLGILEIGFFNKNSTLEAAHACAFQKTDNDVLMFDTSAFWKSKNTENEGMGVPIQELMRVKSTCTFGKIQNISIVVVQDNTLMNKSPLDLSLKSTVNPQIEPLPATLQPETRRKTLVTTEQFKYPCNDIIDQGMYGHCWMLSAFQLAALSCQLYNRHVYKSQNFGSILYHWRLQLQIPKPAALPMPATTTNPIKTDPTKIRRKVNMYIDPS